MKHYTFYPKGVCSTRIDLDVDANNTVHNISYENGCEGNLKAISRLAEGMTIDEVIERLEGISCGWKDTSCSDQLAKSLRRVFSK